MGIYEELQLNQAGSKAIVRKSINRKEKLKHLLIYVFKVLLTMVFCVGFVTIYSMLFGAENSIVGVVVLLSVMVFRRADLGMKASHGAIVMMGIFGILAVGPRLSNVVDPVTGFIINVICLLALSILGCHNIIMSNQSTLVLAYLLLQGYDVGGHNYVMRICGLAVGGLVTAWILYHNHSKIHYKRSFGHLFKEFDMHSVRTQWQIRMPLGISTAMLIAQLLRLPRTMWVGIAVMSIMQPFQKDLMERVKYRAPGNILGGLLFLILYYVLPVRYRSYIGMIGGIGVGFSATYGWQTVFNSFGALAIASGIFGVPGAILLRIVNNVFGSIYGIIFDKICRSVMFWTMAVKSKVNAYSDLV